MKNEDGIIWSKVFESILKNG